MSRKRGGQPRNRNAVKHGFYSGEFNLAEKMSLSLIGEYDLSGEIELFRVQIRRFLESENKSHEKLNRQARREALHTVTFAIECFNRLVRTQAILNSGHGRSGEKPPEPLQLEEPAP